MIEKYESNPITELNEQFDSDNAKLLFFHTKSCPKCPAMLEISQKATQELSIPLEIIDASDIPESLQKKFLEQQIFFLSVPTLILQQAENYSLILNGKIISKDSLKGEIQKRLSKNANNLTRNSVNTVPDVKLTNKIENRLSENENSEIYQRLNALSLFCINFPKVRTSDFDIKEFMPNIIYDSLLKEARIQPEEALKITIQVVQKILGSNISWLSGPLIRELINGILAECGNFEARKRYTRIGMAISEYERFFLNDERENANQYVNPESIHTWAGDKISEEYTLLRLVNEEEANAHLFGDLQIHMLRYFDMRPFCQEWDLRIILKYGLPPIQWAHSAVSKPANKPMVAILHAAKWLGIVQGEFSGGQGYDNFNVFLAPYMVGLSFEECYQLAQCFLFESNQIYAARGAQVPFTSISLTPAVPKSLQNVPAVSFGGKYNGTYGDYQKEANLFFKAMAKAYYDGDATGKLFNFPKMEIKVTREWLKEYEPDYLLVNKTTKKYGQPYFLNQACGWMSDEVHSQCCRIILDQAQINQSDADLFDWNKSYINMGSLQSVSINLPRLGFLCNRDEQKFYAMLDEKMGLARSILLKKMAILQHRMKHKIISICASEIEHPNGARSPLLDFRRQSLSIGILGLNECVKAICGEELHQSEDAFNLGLRIMQYMQKTCMDYTSESGIKFSLWEQPAESSANRFARLDVKHYPNLAIPLGKPGMEYYTNSSHLNYAADIPLDERIIKQAAFHPIIKGGVISHVWLGDSDPDEEALWKLTKNICLRTQTGYFSFSFDFTQCVRCGHFQKGLLNTCPVCGEVGDNLEWWSRVTGYYSRVKRYNVGKKAEFNDRYRYQIQSPIGLL